MTIAYPTPATPGRLVSNMGTVDPGASDLHRASSLVLAIGGSDLGVNAFRLDGEPWSKGRPRFTRTGRTYALDADRDAETRTAHGMRRAVVEPMTGNVALACIFYRSSHQRVDTDNLLKHICDAANKVMWLDDSQVTAVVGVLELDKAHARTVLAVTGHMSTLGRGTDWTSLCQYCGARFTLNPKHTAAKYCGKSCSDTARGHVLIDPVPCAWCQVPFKRNTKTQKFCTVECRASSVRGAPKGVNTFSLCMKCGRALTHKRGGQCRACWAGSAA